MNNTILIDDHLLLRVILGDEPTGLRPNGAAIATTGLWYHRLCRALSDRAILGSMSRRLGDLDTATAGAAIAAVITLPDTIELLSLRNLAWPMAELVHAGARLNLLSLEALAAAKYLGAEICLAKLDDNEPLRSMAGIHGVRIRTIRG